MTLALPVTSHRCPKPDRGQPSRIISGSSTARSTSAHSRRIAGSSARSYRRESRESPELCQFLPSLYRAVRDRFGEPHCAQAARCSELECGKVKGVMKATFSTWMRILGMSAFATLAGCGLADDGTANNPEVNEVLSDLSLGTPLYDNAVKDHCAMSMRWEVSTCIIAPRGW